MGMKVSNHHGEGNEEGATHQAGDGDLLEGVQGEGVALGQGARPPGVLQRAWPKGQMQQ